MMKKPFFFVALLTLVGLASCQTQQKSSDEVIALLKVDLMKDADFLRFRVFEKDFRRKTSIDYYNVFKRDKAFINANIDKLNDDSQAKAIYEKAGMLNVDEYISYQKESRVLRGVLMKRYPILVEDDFALMGQVFEELTR